MTTERTHHARREVSTHLRGLCAQQLAENYLCQVGFEILFKNYRSPQGEIDLIAKEKDTLCFIEVRSRRKSKFGLAIETIGVNKQRHIIQTAQHFLQIWSLY